MLLEESGCHFVCSNMRHDQCFPYTNMLGTQNQNTSYSMKHLQDIIVSCLFYVEKRYESEEDEQVSITAYSMSLHRVP